MTKRFTISGVGISDHEKKRLYDLQTIDGFISIRDLLNELNDTNNQLREEIKDFQTLLASREETYIKPVLRLIDLKMEALKPYNSELCRRVLAELKMEIKGEM